MVLRRYALGAVSVLLWLSVLGLAAAPQSAAQPAPDDSREVTVAIHTLEPFVMKTSTGEWTGFSIDLWTEIAKRLGWDTDYLDAADVNGQLRAVTDRRADLAVGAISLTAQREQSFDFSQPTLDSGLQILVPVHHTRPSVPGLGGYLDLLWSRTMLIWLSAAVVVSVVPAHIFWLIERRAAKPVISRSYFPGIFQAFGWGIGSLVGKNSTGATQSITRGLAILWGFAGIVFVSFYSANLSATLTVAKLESKINGPADLYGKSVATVVDTTASSYLRGMGIDATETRTIDDAYRLLNSEDYDAVVFDAPVLRYYAAHRGEGAVALAGPTFQEESQGYVFAINSPLRKPINHALFSMREDGTYNLIKEKWFGDDEAMSANNPN